MSTQVQGGSPRRPALQRCIGIPVDRFAAENWGRAALLSPSVQTGGFADLFSADAVDDLIAERGLRTPFIRMAKEGSVLPSSRFTSPGGYGAEVADQVDSDKVLAEFAAGATIVLQGLHRVWPPLQAFTRELVAELGHPAQVNAYVTPASSRGFDSHYDVHDVFVLQIAGEKRWVIHEPVHVDPLADEPWSQHADAVRRRAEEPPAIDTVLAPGDALYLPRGWLHSATALGGTTVHLTIGMPAFTRTDLARSLIADAVRAPALRGSLPLGIDVGDAEQLAAEVEQAAAALVEQLRRRGPDASHRLATELGARFTRMTRPEPVRPLRTVDAVAALTADQQIRWRGELRATLVEAQDGVAVHHGSREVRFPAQCAEALRALEGGDRPPAGSLPGLDETDSLTVSRRLLREGIAVLVDAAP